MNGLLIIIKFLTCIALIIYNYNTCNKFLDYVKHSVPIIENVNDKGPLDFNISETDVYISKKSLMNGKSVGLDSIIIE